MNITQTQQMIMQITQVFVRAMNRIHLFWVSRQGHLPLD